MFVFVMLVTVVVAAPLQLSVKQHDIDMPNPAKGVHWIAVEHDVKFVVVPL